MKKHILVDFENNDFSLEGYTALASCLCMIYGAEIAAYRCAETLDAIGAKNTLFQSKKRALNNARRLQQQVISQLEIAFDGVFDHIVTRMGPKYVAQRDAETHALAVEVLKLVIIFVAKSEGMDHDKRQNIFKMLMNFKSGAPELDLEGLIKYFKFDQQ